MKEPDRVVNNILVGQDYVPSHMGITVDRLKEINDQHLTLILNQKDSDVYYMDLENHGNAMIVRKALYDPQLVMVYRGSLIPLDGNVSAIAAMAEIHGKKLTKDLYNECIDLAQKLLNQTKNYVNNL